MKELKKWMPMFWADYFADTRHFNAAEHGAYLCLIGHYWLNGCIPFENDELLRRIASMTPRQWQQSRDIVMSKFDDAGRHKRIDQELAYALEKSKRLSANAKHRLSIGKASADTPTPTPTPTKKDKDYLSEQSSDPQPKTGKSRKKNDYPTDFQKFWTDFPTDPLMSKAEALKQWVRLSPDDRAMAINSVPAFRKHCAENPDYRPVHACRYLSQRRFEGFAGVTGGGPPPGLSDEQRAKWVRDQMEKERAEKSAAANGGGVILDGSERFRRQEQPEQIRPQLVCDNTRDD